MEINEAIIRAAQALMRRGDGTIDEDMLAVLKAFAAVANQKFDFSEKGHEANEQLAVKGQQIINSGAKWRGVLLSDIRKGSTFTITHSRFDALTGITSPGTDRWEITDPWRRAFDIGVGTAEGTSEDNPEQVHTNAVVRSRLGANVAGLPPQRPFNSNARDSAGGFKGRTLSVPQALCRPPSPWLRLIRGTKALLVRPRLSSGAPTRGVKLSRWTIQSARRIEPSGRRSWRGRRSLLAQSWRVTSRSSLTQPYQRRPLRHTETRSLLAQ